jgi:glutamate transport system substrate-binding protein
VGLPPGSDMCEDVNEAIQGLLDSGEINDMLEANTEGVEYTANEELNTDVELESCE